MNETARWRWRKDHRRGWVALVVVLVALGCKKQPKAEPSPEASASAPLSPQELGAWDRYRCTEVADHARPLVVHWSAKARREILERLERGAPAVSYDCDHLEVLPKCRLPAAFTSVTVTATTDQLSLRHPKEAAVHLPTTSEKHGAGPPLDIEFTIRGRRRTLAEVALRPKLVGDCDRATHVVRGVDLGAFSLTSDGAIQRSGKLEKCAERSTNHEPPVDCREVVRLELAPVVASDTEFAQSAQAKRTHLASPCPRGLALSSSSCVVPEHSGPQQCHLESRQASLQSALASCESQCANGSAASCTAFGLAFALGSGVERDPPRAYTFLDRACREGHQAGCVHLATLLFEGQGTQRDSQRAQRLLREACQADPSLGCYELGYRFWQIQSDTAAADAVRYATRACDGGVAQGCNLLGYALAEGRGTQEDPRRALALFERACHADHYAACDSLGEALEKGWGIASNLDSAKRQYDFACTHGVRTACGNAERLSQPAGNRSKPAKP